MQNRDFMRVWLAPAMVLMLVTGCAGAARAPGPMPPAGVATAGDVELVAGGVRWRGWPSDLARFVTPVHVSVSNRGATPVRVSHEEFALVVAGARLAVVLPGEVRGLVPDPPPAALPSAGFTPGYDITGDWVFRGPPTLAEEDPGHTGEQFPLPSKDVLERALREGVLEPGAAASGFVYFERLRGRAGPFELSARLLDARTGEPVGRAVVPFTLP